MQSEASYDVVILGAGSGGKPLAGELGRAGLSVAVIEQGLVGGECPYVACIPSKALLLEARHHVSRTRISGQNGSSEQNGPSGQAIDYDAEAFARAVLLRDKNTRNRDDSHAAEMVTEDGAQLFRGRGVIEDGPGGRSIVVTGTDGRTTRLRWTRALAISTGAAAVVPPIDGLADVGHWTSETALTSDELPPRLLILGGGVIGCELAQVYASFGCAVTLVASASVLLARESPWLGAKMADALRLLGVNIILGQEMSAVHSRPAITAGSPGRPEEEIGSATSAIVATVGDQQIDADRILVAVGKKPCTKGFGVELLGLTPGEAIGIDARCRARTSSGEVLGDVYALGDVTGVAPYTHTANYHARTVAAHLLGYGVDADHTGIPRVVYTNPAVLCAGLTEEQARQEGHEPITARFDATQTSRSAIERTAHRFHHEVEAKLPAEVELIADATSGVLLGVAAIGPEADSWAAELALAVRQRTTVQELAQALHAFPSWTEAIHPPARELADKVRGIKPTAGSQSH